MSLTQYTERHIVRLLATETRRTDTTPHALSASHIALGRFLAGELVERLELEVCDIQHPQGVRPGWRVAAEPAVVVLPFMRAGLYVAEGVREVLQSAPVLHVQPERNVGLSSHELGSFDALDPHTVVIADAVVNTGASLEPVLSQLKGRVRRVFVLALVAPVETAERLARTWPDVEFLFARTSTNQYVGAATTDTGNRLFGTTRRREA
jgi:uracil phosphoribosyltransferase